MIVVAVAVAAPTRSEISLAPSTYAFGAAFSPDGARAYVTLEGTNGVAVVDAATLAVTTTIPNPGGALAINTPWGIAATGDRIFVASQGNNRLGVIDAATNTYEAVIPIPAADANNSNDVKTIVIASGGDRGYAMARDELRNGNGSLTAFDTQTLQVIGSVTGLLGSNDVALSVDGATAYVASLAGDVIAIDTSSLTVVPSRGITVPGRIIAVAVDPRGGHLYAYNDVNASRPNPDQVEVIDLATRTIIRTVEVSDGGFRGGDFNQIAVAADGRRAFLSSHWGGSTQSGSTTELDIEDPTVASVVASFDAERAYGIGISPTAAHVITAMNTNPAKVMALTMDLPGAPAQAAAVAGAQSATVSWSAPVSDGGAPILAYTVAAAEDPAKSCTTLASLPTLPARSCTVTGLAEGSTYTFTVTPRNGIGDGPSATSNAVTVPKADPTPTPGPEPTTPTLSASLTSPSRVKSGRSFRVTIAVENTTAIAVRAGRSSAAANSVKTCLRLPRGLFVVSARRAEVRRRSVCWTRTTLAAGSTLTYRAVVRSPEVAPTGRSARRVRLSVRATAEGGVAPARATATVRISRSAPPSPQPVTG